MFGNATDLLVLEVLSPYRLQDLGSEESSRDLMGHGHCH